MFIILNCLAFSIIVACSRRLLPQYAIEMSALNGMLHLVPETIFVLYLLTQLPFRKRCAARHDPGVPTTASTKHLVLEMHRLSR
jgi:hypothetical protein